MLAQLIIQAIRNTFSLSKTEDICRISSILKLYSNQELLALLDVLADEKMPPKVIAEALEKVVLHIKLKDNPTKNELEFLNQINNLFYKSLYLKKVSDDDTNNNASPPRI